MVEIAKSIQPSSRGELEITDVNRTYLANSKLDVVNLGRGMAWLDTGTHNALLEATSFIATIEKRQGLKVSCPEELAYQMGFIDATKLRVCADSLKSTSYGMYLSSLIKE